MPRQYIFCKFQCKYIPSRVVLSNLRVKLGGYELHSLGAMYEPLKSMSRISIALKMSCWIKFVFESETAVVWGRDVG